MLQQVFDEHLKQARAATLADSPQWTLGRLIDALESIPTTRRNYRGETERRHVRFDFEYLRPSGLDSWRGVYRELAIGFATEGTMHLDDFLTMLRQAVGKTYEGYKGGTFRMDRSTPLWVANYGNAGDTGVVGVRDDDYDVVLLTAACPT